MKLVTRGEIEHGPGWVRLAASALLAVYLVFALYLLWRTAVLAPFSDEFNWAARWYQLQDDHQWLAYVLAPHNINRLLWTRLAVALDMGALGGTNAPLILSGAAALAVMAATLGREAAVAAPPPAKPLAGALAVMLTLMAGNVLDASIPIYATYAHAAVFAVLAIVLAEGASGGASRWRAAGAIACAMASALGSGAGLALWPVMAWGALRRRDWTWLSVVLICGAAFIGLYLSGQGGAPATAAATGLHDPRSAVMLSLSFLALPWARLAPQSAWIAGVLVALVAIALILAKGGDKAGRSERIACGLMLFTLGAAALAGLRSGLEDARDVPLRYGLLVAPLHAGLVILVARRLAGPWEARRRLIQTLGLALLVGVFLQNLAMGPKLIEVSDVLRDAVADFHDGRRTPMVVDIVHPNLLFAETVLDRMNRDDLFQHELHLKPQPASR